MEPKRLGDVTNFSRCVTHGCPGWTCWTCSHLPHEFLGRAGFISAAETSLSRLVHGQREASLADRYVEHPWSFNDPEVPGKSPFLMGKSTINPKKDIQKYSHLRICLDIFMIFQGVIFG